MSVENVKVREAHVNEFKGVLLEYASARNLETLMGLKFDPGQDFYDKVFEYQNYLLACDQATFFKIQSASKIVSSKISEYLEDKSEYSSIQIAGKNHIESWGEADLKIISNLNEPKFFSLKMIKDKSFINTKSAGIFSVFKKYFASYGDISFIQEEITYLANLYFNEMSSKLLKNYGEEFNDSFSNCWARLGLSDRPGELKDEDREVLLTYYYKLMNAVKGFFSEIYRKDPQVFMEGMKQLCGFSSNLVKVVYAYKDKSFNEKDICFIETWSDESEKSPKNLNDLKFLLESSNSKSSFKLKLGNKIIEFRIKPMNKFTTPGVKLNVSIKYCH